MFSDLLYRLRALFRRDSMEAELDEELRAHLEHQVEKYLQSGMLREEAQRRAKIEFGGLDQIKEECRDSWGVRFIETLLQDIRFGLRMLAKNPGFTAVAVITLALGIGANTAIFTLAYATLLAPLPYPEPEQLVMVWSKLQGHRNTVSAGDFTDWKRQSRAFEDLNAWTPYDFNIATKEKPEFVEGMQATPGYNRMLGNPLFLGRNFLSEEGEAGSDQVVIVTYRLWRHLGANTKIIGQAIQINGEPYTVVGVMAPGTADRWDEELIVPLVFKPDQLNHNFRWLFVTGRLKRGVNLQQAQAEMDKVAANEAKDYSKSNYGWGALVEPLKNDFLPGDRQSELWVLSGAVGFLLLIACLNVANLLLAKGITRQREVTIRTSLGARPAAIFAQFLTESVVLTIPGGLLGVALGYAMLWGLLTVMPPHTLSAEADVRLNVHVLVMMLVVLTLTGALVGCAPAWYTSRLDPSGILKEGGRSGIGVGRHQLRRALVVAEFALALPLLAGAGLAIHSFWRLTQVDLGVRTDHVLGFYLDAPSLIKNPKQINSYYARILASIAAVPGVSHVCAMAYLPLDSLHDETAFAIVGRPPYSEPTLRPTADLQMATPDYFQTFGIRIVKGRGFTAADNASSFRVAMVNEAFANRFLKGDPLKQRVKMEKVIPGAPNNGPVVDWQIVGVFHTVKSRGFREDHPEIDVPFWQSAFPIAGIGVNTAEEPASMFKSIATAVNIVDRQAALYMPRTMEQVHDEILANDRFTVNLFAGFAVVALLLAAVGVNGLAACSAAQRSREIALRLALGATRSQVVALVVKEGLVLASIGLGFGLIGAYFVGRAMQVFLFGMGAIDFSTISAVGLALLFAALLACYLPARRVARMDPMLMLRHE
jgi:putative ABC transport system permease protein